MHTPLMSMTTLTPFMMPYSCQIKIGSSNEITPFVSTVHADRPVRESAQQLAGDCKTLTFHLGPPPRPTASNNVTHDASGTEICEPYNVGSFRLPVCPLVLDTWLPLVTPWQMVSKTPQMSSAELKHPYNTLNSSASLWDIQTKRGFPGIGHTGPRYSHMHATCLRHSSTLRSLTRN